MIYIEYMFDIIFIQYEILYKLNLYIGINT